MSFVYSVPTVHLLSGTLKLFMSHLQFKLLIHVLVHQQNQPDTHPADSPTLTQRMNRGHAVWKLGLFSSSAGSRVTPRLNALVEHGLQTNILEDLN